jgi:hypothetical protein
VPEALTHFDWLKTQKEWNGGNYPVIARLDMLYPPFMAAVVQLMKISHARGWPFEVFETFRSAKRQAFVCGQGFSQMTVTGPHNFGLACDIVAHIEGRDSPWSWKAADAPWSKLGAAGEDLGLVWGGRWKHPFDPAHFQCVVVDQALYKRIREGKYYPDWAPADAKATECEPQQIALYRELYDAAAYMPEERRQKFLRTLNIIRPYVSEDAPVVH